MVDSKDSCVGGGMAGEGFAEILSDSKGKSTITLAGAMLNDNRVDAARRRRGRYNNQL